MATPRRLLPSISQLTAFEALCRTGTTTAAARDLALTQGVISRIVATLEGQLGVPLFRREGRRLLPTEAALAYSREVGRALDLISRGSMRVRSSQGGGTLSLSILPAFGTRWMAPRLRRFVAAHPGVTLNLGTRLRPFDMEEEGFDAAIHFGDANWPDADHLKLFDESLVATCAPDFLSGDPLNSAEDLMTKPLLQLETRPTAWVDWLDQHGIQAQAPYGMIFDQFSQMIEAAIQGLGVALLPEFLIEAEVKSGKLVIPWGKPIRSAGCYYLVWPKRGAWYPPLRAFREWIAAEADGLAAPPVAIANQGR